MHLEFSYDFDDYEEANRSHRSSGSAGSGRALLLRWIVFIALAAFLFLLLSSKPSPRRGPATTAPVPGSSLLVNFFLPFIPWLLIFGFIWLFIRRQLRGAKPKSFLYDSNVAAARAHAISKRYGLMRRILLVVAITAGCLGILYLLFESTGSIPDVLLPILPWLLIFGFIWFFVFRALRGNWRKVWEGQPQLHGPQTMDAGEDGVTVATPLSRAEYRWEAFQHVRETPNLFLLYMSNFSFHMVPKRSFASDAEVDQFRSLVRNFIAERPAPAFPVVMPPALIRG
jgi:hypothetical protein